jgi:alpha,alpha-trehalase
MERPHVNAQIVGFVFDLDGVLTDTAEIHKRAWKRMFDDFLRERAGGSEFEPFSEDDYLKYVDGRPRYDGCRAFLESRAIDLPQGDREDEPGKETVCGLGNLKNKRYVEQLDQDGVEPFPGSVEFVKGLRSHGVPRAVISASKNCVPVLEAAGIRNLFDEKVDGVDSEELGLKGKPDPAIFLEAAKRIGVEPSEAAIVEDAQAGVEAGRRGRFGLVIGIARSGDKGPLEQKGADIVVGDLSELDAEEIVGMKKPR